MRQPGLTLILCMMWPVCSTAGDGQYADGKRGFIENKGQISDQEGRPNPAVLYLLNSPGMNVQLRQGGFSYDFYGSPTIEEQTLNLGSPLRRSRVTCHDTTAVVFHRLDFDLVGADPF